MATITALKNGKYRIRKTYEGVSYSEILDFRPSKNAADDIIWQKIIKEKDSRSQIKKGSMSLFDCCQNYIEMRRPILSPSTVNGYYGDLNRFSKETLDTDIQEIDKSFIQGLINEMTINGLSAKTIKNRINLLLSSIREERDDFKPKIKYPQKRKIDSYIPNDDDYSRLMDMAKGSEYEIALYLGALGLRRSEICALTPEDFDENGVNVKKAKVLNDKKEWVIKPYPKNTESERYIPLPENIIEIVKERGYVYRLKPGAISNYIHKCVKKIGIRDFSLHKLRHYFATKAHLLSVPDKSIMKMGGWKTEYVMKNIYRHADEENAKENMKNYQKHLSKITKK